MPRPLVIARLNAMSPGDIAACSTASRSATWSGSPSRSTTSQRSSVPAAKKSRWKSLCAGEEELRSPTATGGWARSGAGQERKNGSPPSLTTSWACSEVCVRRSPPTDGPSWKECIGDRSNPCGRRRRGRARGENRRLLNCPDSEAAFSGSSSTLAEGRELCLREYSPSSEALDKTEAPVPAVSRSGHRHVQYEPVCGGSEDSAEPRAAAIIAWRDRARVLPLLVDAMPTRPRVASHRRGGLGAPWNRGCWCSSASKGCIGARTPKVLSECLSEPCRGRIRRQDTGFLVPASAARPRRRPSLGLGLPACAGPLATCWAAAPAPPRGARRAGPPGPRHAPTTRRHRLPAGPHRLRFKEEMLVGLKIHNSAMRLRERLLQVVLDPGSPRFERCSSATFVRTIAGRARPLTAAR